MRRYLQQLRKVPELDGKEVIRQIRLHNERVKRQTNIGLKYEH